MRRVISLHGHSQTISNNRDARAGVLSFNAS
jgi:hypothetical protein